MRNHYSAKRQSLFPAFAVFVLLTWAGLRLVAAPAETSIVSIRWEESGGTSIPIAAQSQRDLPRWSQTAPIVDPVADPVADPMEQAYRWQCTEALFLLGASADSSHCADPKVSERIRDAGMACARTREPEDLGPGSACESTQRTMQAFLQMLPAYRNPRLIGEPHYPADRFFAGVSEYLQMIAPEEEEVLLEAGLEALHQLSETRASLQNAQSWAEYWQDVSPELAGRIAQLEVARSKSRELQFN
jgi:hypothetical protein